MDLGHRMLMPETSAEAFGLNRPVASFPWIGGLCRVLSAHVQPPQTMMRGRRDETEPGPKRTLPLA